MRDVRCAQVVAHRSKDALPALLASVCTSPDALLSMMHCNASTFQGFFMLQNEREVFIPDTVLVQFCLPPTAFHGCIIVAVATNCTSVIPSTLASPITLVTSVTLAILVTSVILVNVVTHHLATLKTLPHSLPHPKLPLPHLPLLPPFKTFADPVASAIDHILKMDPV